MAFDVPLYKEETPFTDFEYIRDLGPPTEYFESTRVSNSDSTVHKIIQPLDLSLRGILNLGFLPYNLSVVTKRTGHFLTVQINAS
ncbi:protein of unknown function [Candidatus Nitrosocosmicus franklandus]|uniref:Uncharacterized protein n=1 Tax=Candidatus Nitrosocosmicus franklandianus TaxID=1798806 RepID=A0A484IE07_9ARCH|nr:protein of unknown function [Candidatus Nitrosocosmicus franklandus]